MKVELAGAAAFACLGLIAGALLRPQAGDFRQEPLQPAGFQGPPSGPVGGADPTGGWSAGGWSGNGPVPDYVVGTDSRQPPPGDIPPVPAWEEEAAAAPAEPPSSTPPAGAPTEPAPPASPSPSRREEPKEGE